MKISYTNSTSGVRFMVETLSDLVRNDPNVDPSRPGAGGLDFTAHDEPLVPARFDVEDTEAITAYVGTRLGTTEHEGMYEVVVNKEKGLIALLVYRPEVFERTAA